MWRHKKTEAEKRAEALAFYKAGLERESWFTSTWWSAPKSDKSFWANYNIEQSLRPYLFNKKKYDAALVIRDAIRMRLARKRAEKEKHADAEVVLAREAVKVQKVWRSYKGRKQRDLYRNDRYKEQESWKFYDDFRRKLLTEGEQVLRWRHSKNAAVWTLLKIDKSRRWIQMYSSRARKAKKILLKDVYDVATGYSSPFLRDLVTQASPEKHMSLLVRDSQRGGRETSIDVVFDVVGKDEAEDGKFKRDKFFANFKRLLMELQGEDAFFFASFGDYGRVSRSVFDRWERISLLDPDWQGVSDEDFLGIADHHRHGKTSKKSKKKGPATWFEPWPLAQDKKPQNLDFQDLLYRCVVTRADGTTQEVAARWWSETTTVDYKDRLDQHFEADGSKPPSRRFKEKFVLQKCAAVSNNGKKITIAGLQPLTLADLPRSERSRLRDRSSSVEPMQQPVVMPLSDLVPYFAELVRKKYGELGIYGWRNVETKEFEFDAQNWTKIEALALSHGGDSHKQEAAQTASRLRRAKVAAAAANGQRADNHATPQPPTHDDDLSVGPQQQSQGPKIKTPNLKQFVVGRETPVVRLRRELLKQMWNNQSSGIMYKPAVVTYNSSQKIKFEDEKKELEREATERKQHVQELKDQEAAKKKDAFTSSRTLATSNAGRSMHSIVTGESPRSVRSGRSARSAARSAPRSPSGASSRISDKSSDLDDEEIVLDPIIQDEVPDEDEAQREVQMRTKSARRLVPSMRISKSRADHAENKAMRQDSANTEGIRFQLVVLEKTRRSKKHKTTAKRSRVGFEVVKKDYPLKYGKQEYPASLVVVGCAMDAVPSIAIAYEQGKVRDGDHIVAVNKIFPQTPNELVDLLLDATHKRALTLVRLYENVDAQLLRERTRNHEVEQV